MRGTFFSRASLIVLFAGLLVGCARQRRQFDEPGDMTNVVTPHPSPDMEEARNAYALGEGQRLYTWFNCNGCHGLSGGGGIGPPLRDAQWIYGGTPSAVYTSIVTGRPNGMPAFGGRIPRFQARQLAAYVLSLGNAVPRDVAPGRSDSVSIASQAANETPARPEVPGRLR
jgi:cytochrome c oxidase cbb3-type subunit 3